MLKAPEVTGEHRVRLLTAGSAELAADTLTVVPAMATVTLLKSEVIAGNEIKVQWSGSDNEFDEIASYTLDGNTKFNRAFAFEARYPSPALKKVPEQAGDYLIRLMTGGGKELAKSISTVQPANASIDAPAKVKASAEFNVAWQGPDNESELCVEK